jgi:hypothetical protein
MMARVGFAYARALLAAAPLADVARAVLLRGWRLARPRFAPPPVDGAAARAAADALACAPRLFTRDDLRAAYDAHVPGGRARARRRATRILDGEIEVFGRVVTLGPAIDWHVDRLSGRRFDPDAPSETIDLFAGGADPKGAWEPARAGHLVELGAAARLCPALAAAARAAIRREIEQFLDGNRLGRGVHYAAPLEVALRCVHWLAALELAGGARVFPRGFLERLGASLVEQGFFLAAHLEDDGVVPANHLLGELVGLWALGLALGGAPGAAAWRAVARRRLPREAARQVGSDGAHFEASTAYHRFALELILVAHRWSAGAAVELGLGETLHRMLLYLRGTLAPDGSEPGFGDGDDARVMPLAPRAPRQHGYLLPVGVALFGDPALRAHGPVSEEALWLCGPAAADAWAWTPPTPGLSAASFVSGGVHVLRSSRLYVALRAGGYGQRGVGGHGHNDQLGVVVSVDGRPAIVDPGTGCYTADPLVRDRFRGTGAHATVVVDGAEQSPLIAGRPFALPDRARASRVRLEDVGAVAELVAEHHGYRRLPARACHRRTLTLHRALDALVIEDALTGEGTVSIDVRFPLALPARLGATPRTRAQAEALAPALGLGPLDPSRAFEIGSIGALMPIGAGPPLQPSLETAGYAPRYGALARCPLAVFRARLSLPVTVQTVFLLYGPEPNG